MLESKEGLVTERVFRLHLIDDDDIFDPNTELPIFVVSGLIRYDVSGGEGNLCVLNSGSNAYWTFMNIQERPNTMSGAVSVIKTILLFYRSATSPSAVSSSAYP